MHPGARLKHVPGVGISLALRRWGPQWGPCMPPLWPPPRCHHSRRASVWLQVLEKWRAGGHKALLFTQTQQMLDIIERHVADAGMRYLRMDGSVPPKHRFRMIDHFNRHPAGAPPPDAAGPQSPPSTGARSDDAAPTTPDASAADAACDAACDTPPPGGPSHSRTVVALHKRLALLAHLRPNACQKWSSS